MGMDVYGREPRNEVGEYFRSNVWWWRPLWNYTAEIDHFYAEQKNAHQLISKKLFESGHHNDGEGLETEEDCRDLVKRLEWSIDEGLLAEYQKEIDESTKEAKATNEALNIKVEALRKKVVTETGDKDIIPRDYPEEDYAEWKSLQSERDYNDSYPFSQEHVEEWIAFLKVSGGFEIR